MSDDRESGEATASNGMTDARQPVACFVIVLLRRAMIPTPLGGDTRAKQDSYPDDLPQPYILQRRSSRISLKLRESGRRAVESGAAK
jgi:hypothetical protein